MISPDTRLYLASESPRRAQLLRQIGIGFKLVTAAVDETPRTGEKAFDYVGRLAVAKARSGWHQLSQLFPAPVQLPVLGADTSVVLNEHIMGKPQGKEDALNMLSALSATTHQVMTSVCLKYGEIELMRVIVTDVIFRAISKSEMRDYWDTGEPQGKAGSYAIQGQGAIFVERIQGSYSGVVGLPLAQTYQLLQQIEQEASL